MISKGGHLKRRTLLGAAAVSAGAGLFDAGTTASAGEASAPSARVGRARITCLLDAAGPFGLGTSDQMFPEATRADWAAARRLDPHAFLPGGRWHLNFHCYLIRFPRNRIFLVDTGVGPVGSPASSWAPVPGRLPEVLAAVGITPEDVDLVIQTHLHADHLGWAVMPDGSPMFPRARYAVQHREIRALETSGSPLVSLVVEPLRRTGQLHELDGRVTLAGRRGQPGTSLIVVPTSGHTPGHQSVLVADDDDQVIITGDVLVHAVQLANPDLAYVHESDQPLARATRRWLLRYAEQNNIRLATAHLHPPFVHAG